jgi:hypothetical protein
MYKVQNLFQLTIVNARSEDDLDKEEIIKLVHKGLHNYDAQAKPGNTKSTITVQSSKESLTKASTTTNIKKEEIKLDKQESEKYWQKNQVQEKEIQTTKVEVTANTEDKKKFWTAPKATEPVVSKTKVEIDSNQTKKVFLIFF